ncbi:MAG: SBBP repeat-containing protein, partial [Phormidium sp.]
MTNVIWAKGFGGTGHDAGNDIVTDSSSNITYIYTTGTFYDSATFGIMTLTSQGSGDIFVTKQDRYGNVAWAKSFGGGQRDMGLSIVTDSSGNLYTTGSFGGTATFGNTTLTSQGGTDIFVTKLDNSGNVAWAKSFGDTNNDTSYSIASDSSGNLYTTGGFQGSATFGNTTLTSKGSDDIFVTKLDSRGNVAWAKSFGGAGTGSDDGRSISTDNSGNTYVTGTFQTSATFGNTTLTSKGNVDIFVTKLDSSGNVAWAKSFGDKYIDTVTKIFTDGSSNTYITYTIVGPSGTIPDPFLTKLDSSGNVTWTKSLAGPGYGIASDSSGNLYVTGGFTGTKTFGSATLTSQGIADIYVAKLDSSGNITEAIDLGGSGSDLGRSIATDSSDNLYVTGGFNNTATFGTKLLNSKGSQDIFVAKLGVVVPTVKLTTGTNAQEQGTVNGLFSFTLDYPAPAGGLTINYNLDGTATRNSDYHLATGTNITAVTPTSFTIAAGQTTAFLNVTPVDDTDVEGTEAVRLTLTSGSNYQLDTLKYQGTIGILDDDVVVPIIPPVITIAAGTNPSEAGSTDGTFVITLDKPAPAGGLSINYGVAGTATNNTDYHLAPGNNIIAATATDFTIAAGQTTATLNVSPFDDNVVDPNETVQLTLNNGTGYSLGLPKNATVTIADDDVTIPV